MSTAPNLRYRFAAVMLFVAVALAGGCATSQPRSADAVEADPLEPANRVFYDFNEMLDRYFMRPVAETYVDITPRPVRTAVTNFFSNLTYLNVIVNDFLQGKFYQGVNDTARFVINSTLGLGGLFDVATDAGLPAHQEDFGQTLAVWGAGQGAYLYLPVRGPNSVRDAPDMVTSYFLNPLSYVTGAVLWPVTALNVVNMRANLLDETRIRDEAAVDAYSFTREAYIQRRQYLIFDGNPPTEGYDDIFGDTADDGSLVIE
jgi:phospholipid-binding lipoprotein MlaA